MPLPLSGEISIRDINVEINSIEPEVQRDLESAGIIFELDIDVTNWSDTVAGLGMDEFYGESLGDLSVEPQSWQFPNTGGNKVFNYTSRAGTITVVDNRTWLSISNVGTSLPDGSFTVTAQDNSDTGAPARVGSVTVSNSTENVIVAISQNAGPTPTIDIDPDIREVGGLTTSANFTVFTNAPSYTVVSIPSFATGFTIGPLGPTINFSQNNSPGATTREGNVVVQTVTGFQTEVQDTAVLRQLAAPQESITVTPRNNDFTIDASGEVNKYFDVTTAAGYTTTWLPFKESFFGESDTWATIVDTVEQTNTASFRVTFTSNPIGGSSRTIRIGARKVGGTLEGIAVITQDAAANAFTYADAGVSGFSVARNTGQVTAPQASSGTITSRVYSSGYSGGFYPLVTSNTARSVNVTVTVPSGYDNSGGTVSGTETFTQDIADETLSIASSTGTGITNTGEAFSISVTTSPVYNTSWSAVLVNSSPNNSSGWISFSGAGTGDSSFTVSVGSNSSGNPGYTGANRTFSIRVDRVGGSVSSNTLSFTQTVYTPPPPPDEVNLVVLDSGCTSGLNSGYIDLSATDGSGNYRYHIDTQLPANLNLSNTYNGLQDDYNLSNGTYYVAVYDLTNNVYDFTTISINCLTTYYIFSSCSGGSNVMTSTVVPSSSQRAFDSSANFYSYTNTTTTNVNLHTIRSLTLQAATGCPPVYISWLAERNSDGFVSRLGPYPNGYSINDEVYANNQCWTILGESESSAVYTITGACPPPTTPGYNCVNGSCVFVADGAQYSTLAACQSACTPSLTSFDGSVNSNSSTACTNAFTRPRTYQSTSTNGLVTGATIYSGAGALMTNTTYISNGSVYGTTDSSGVFTQVGTCQQA